MTGFEPLELSKVELTLRFLRQVERQPIAPGGGKRK